MKNNERRFRAIQKLISIDLFYIISIGKFDIQMQGDFKSETVIVLLSKKFKQLPFSESGYAEFKRGLVKVTLT